MNEQFPERMEGFMGFQAKILTLFFAGLLFIHCATPPELRKSQAADPYSALSPEEKVRKKKADVLLSRANAEFQKSKFDSCLSLAIESAETFPTPEAFYLSGASLFKSGETEKSVEYFEKGLQLSPKHEQILLTLASVYSSRGEEEKALEIFEKLAEYYPTEPLYNFKKGVLYKSKKEYAQALKELKTAEEKKFPQKAQLYSQMGDVLLQLRQYDEANQYFSLAGEANPEAKSIKEAKSATKLAGLFEKGNSAVKKGELDRAEEIFKQAVDIAPNAPTARVFLGNVQLLLKKKTEAEKQFKKALELEPKNKEAISALGSLYTTSGNHTLAIVLLKKGIELFPSDSILQNKLGLVYKEKGDLKKAILSFSRAKELEPGDVGPRLNLARVLLEEGKVAEAKRELAGIAKNQISEEVKNFTKFLEVYTFILQGDGFIRSGKFPQALAQYQSAKNAAPREPVVLNAFGRYYFLQKNYSESVKNFRDSLKKDPGNIPALTGLARTYGKMESKKDLLEVQSMLNKISKDNIHAAISIGRIYEDREEYQKAEEEYAKLLKQHPDHEAVKYRLGMLYYKKGLDSNKNEKYDEAISFLEKASKLVSDVPEIAESILIIKNNKNFGELVPIVKKANRAFDKKDYKEAILFYNEAYKKQSRPGILIKISESYIGMGEEEKGLSILQKALDDKKEGKLEIREAIYSFFLKKGLYEKALKGFKEIIETRPESWYSHYQIGMIHLMQKKFKEAISSFDSSILIKNDYTPSYVARGLAYYQSGDKNRARSEFNDARKREPEKEIASYNIAVMELNENKLSDAEKTFIALTEKFPEFSEAYYHLSYIYFSRNETAKAEEKIKQAYKLEKSPQILYAYIRILEDKARQGDRESSTLQFSLFQEMKSLYPVSELTKLASKRLARKVETDAYTEPYPISGSLLSPPVFLNNKMILNYGQSIVMLDALNKKRIWRNERVEPCRSITVGTMIYCVGNGFFEELDPSTGSTLFKIPAEIYNNEAQAGLGVAYFVTRKKSGDRILSSVNLDGKILGEYSLGRDGIWKEAGGYIFVMKPAKESINFEILNPDLTMKNKSQLQGVLPEKASLVFTGFQTLGIVSQNSIYKFEESKLSPFFKGDPNLIGLTINQEKAVFFSGGKIQVLDMNSYTMKSVPYAGTVASDIWFANDSVHFINAEGEFLQLRISGKSTGKTKVKESGNKLFTVIFK